VLARNRTSQTGVRKESKMTRIEENDPDAAMLIAHRKYVVVCIPTHVHRLDVRGVRVRFPSSVSDSRPAAHFKQTTQVRIRSDPRARDTRVPWGQTTWQQILPALVCQSPSLLRMEEKADVRFYIHLEGDQNFVRIDLTRSLGRHLIHLIQRRSLFRCPRRSE
jgi:hypothetical protein